MSQLTAYLATDRGIVSADPGDNWRVTGRSLEELVITAVAAHGGGGAGWREGWNLSLR